MQGGRLWGCLCASTEMKPQGGDVANIATKKRVKMLSGGDVFDLIGDVDPTDEDGDIEMGDSTGVLASLGGEIFSGGKKCRESNIGGGEIDSEDKRSLVKSSEESGEMFPGVTGE
ncbi:hypothetical protein Tco_1039736 [Tanacetum coccineum]